jgi:hypothetical protein
MLLKNFFHQVGEGIQVRAAAPVPAKAPKPNTFLGAFQVESVGLQQTDFVAALLLPPGARLHGD